ncbi:MAG: tRNA 4-thiouridine(8) synthase ThiI [Ruminococcaceae bacterium]|nr:tRNA 4-thiouridine(8) synthase ThiI [Oscillospiraceae bacterium]
MLQQLVLIKYGEIILKGLNRPIFEEALVKNIKAALPDSFKGSIHRAQATIYVEPDDPEIIDEIIDRLTKVFGITSLTRAFVLPKDIEAMKKGAAEALAPVLSGIRRFKAEAKRADKKFPLTSPEIAREVGGYLHDCFSNLTVDVVNPEEVVMIEVREQNAYVYCGRVKGAGGMPLGSNSKATLLLSGGIDSPVAGYMTAKRGVRLNAVHFFSYPYTGERARDKVLSLAKILSAYNPRFDVHIVPFTEAQLAIKKNCPEEQLTIIMRRLMMRMAEQVARKTGARALVTGESIGQVASQTVEALAVTDAVAGMPVFRPVIGMDKEEIVTIARQIGTFETSILPYEDCCTIFTPKHPNTKPRLDKIELSERNLDIDKLVEDAVNGIEIVRL